MDRIIRQITDELIGLLPDDEQYYRVEELREWGFPRFILQRIQVELERNLADSMQLPRTDWANVQSATVKEVWEQFLEAIHAEARLPASYAHTVIETAVADVLEMLVQPRKNIPEIIFGSDKKLTREELENRVEAVVVYLHFAALLPRYMEKKGLDTITKERCADVVAKADEKMTSRYSPLNWAQMLEPLFNLSDEQIDTNLLRLFFEDKKMPRIARKFDLMNAEVNRAELIEVLSSPDSLNLEGYEDEQSDLFEAGKSEKKTMTAELSDNKKKPVAPKPEPVPKTDSPSETKKKEPGGSSPEPDAKEDEDPAEETLATESDEPEESGEVTINTLFKEDEDEEDYPDVEPEDDLNRQFTDEEETAEVEADETTDETEEAPEEPEEDAQAPEPEEDEKATSPKSGVDMEIKEAEDIETPMWQRFLKPEDLEALESEEEQEELDDEGFIEEPIIDLTKNNEDDEKGAEELSELLKDDSDYFVEEIFRGSERAYEEAVQDIAAMDNWRSASKYIEKEVFKRNLVDMYSEAAVEFTDRLQSYFLEKSKS